MKWPLLNRPIPDRQVPLYNRIYLHASGAIQVDPTIVWGTEIDADALQEFLRKRNREGHVVITAAHALIRATALALVEFPEFNVRIVRRRVYTFRDVNIRMAFLNRRSGEIDVLMIRGVNLKRLEQIGLEVWRQLLQAGRGEVDRDRDLSRLRRIPDFYLRQILRLYGFLDRNVRLPTVGRIDATRECCTTVNDLSFPGAPLMRSYKPSRFPDQTDTLNLTLGGVENKVVARSGHFMSTSVMPLFMRADHRLVDAYQVGRFLAAVRNLLHHPERLDLFADQPSTPRSPASGYG
jgi:2-oxoacid dehydrogenases acyltransferase (catalytic domain)